MISTLKYGLDSALELDFQPGVLIADCAAPAGLDAGQAAKQAIENPLEFPQLSRAVVPGDHIVLVLGPGVPQASAVVAAAVPALVAGGAGADDIVVLRTARDQHTAEDDPRSQLPPTLRNAVGIAIHDPEKEDDLSFLAADDHGEAIYMNRRLCDADLVIPIGCQRPDFDLPPGDKAHARRGGLWNDCLYPAYTDRTSVEHMLPNGVPLTAGQIAQRHQRIDHVAWLMGIQFTAQVVPGANSSALAIYAGLPGAVFPAAPKTCLDAWKREVPGRANLVIAGIGGDRSQQNWANVGRALEASLRVVADNGVIVLCTAVSEPLGPGLKVLAAAADGESAASRLRKIRSADAQLAQLLVDSLDHVTIYLLSEVNEDAVQSLGMAHVSDPNEIANLAAHHQSCILIADAQYVQPQVAGEQIRSQ